MSFPMVSAADMNDCAFSSDGLAASARSASASKPPRRVNHSSGSSRGSQRNQVGVSIAAACTKGSTDSVQFHGSAEKSAPPANAADANAASSPSAAPYPAPAAP